MDSKNKCIVCNSEDFGFILKKRGYKVRGTYADLLSEKEYFLIRCKGCGLRFITPQDNGERSSELYSKDYFHGIRDEKFVYKLYLKSASSLIWRIRARKVAKYLKRGERILDIGCGWGDFLFHMEKKGYRGYGVDVSEEACRISRTKVKGIIRKGHVQDCNFPSDYFHVVTMWHVLEHIPDPIKVLQEIYRILKEDGHLIISVPNIECISFKIAKSKWQVLDFPRHLYHFSPSTLRFLLSNAGYNVSIVNHTFFESPFDLLNSILTILKGKKIEKVIRIILPVLFVLCVGIQLLSAIGGKGPIFEVYCRKKRL